MQIIYYSYWGTYSAYLTAALHTGIYPAEGLPSIDRIKEQFEMSRRFADQTGNLIYVGMDDQLREVYSIGCRKHGAMVVRAIQNVNEIFDVSEPVRFFHAGSREGVLPRIVQYSLLRWNSRFLFKLYQIWFRQYYRACRKAAEQAKQSLGEGI